MKQKPLTAALVLAALVSFPAAAAERKNDAPRPAPASEAGMKIHVDPATGQVVAPKSDPAAARKATAAAPAESFPPAKVEKVTTKAGGIKVALHGRFMMETTATVGPDGKVVQACEALEESRPAAAPEKERRNDR